MHPRHPASCPGPSHASKLGVPISESVSLSRCGLYQRFQKVLKRSVHDEIKRVRAEKIAQLLVESDQSIGQIALDMGFQDACHIARYFKKIKGVTPLAYRRKFGRR